MSHKKTLKDIPINSVDLLHRLAALAPEAEKSTSNPQPRPAFSHNAGSHAPGRWQVEKWLEHYGIRYNPKIEATRTIFRLYECPFDPSHGKYESSIIQSNDGSGPIVLECKHSSCNHSWVEWRSMVDRGRKHNEFFENPYPKKSFSHRGSRTSSPSTNGDRSPFDCGLPFEQIPEAKLPPGECSPSWFFDGKTLRPSWLADYLKVQNAPAFFDGGDFWSYQPNEGVYQVVPAELLRQQAKRALQKHANAHLIANGLKLLECETFIPAKELAADPELINLKNGMLHWPTMRLLDHDPRYRSRIQLNAALEALSNEPSLTSI